MKLCHQRMASPKGALRLPVTLLSSDRAGPSRWPGVEAMFCPVAILATLEAGSWRHVGLGLFPEVGAMKPLFCWPQGSDQGLGLKGHLLF